MDWITPIIAIGNYEDAQRIEMTVPDIAFVLDATFETHIMHSVPTLKLSIADGQAIPDDAIDAAVAFINLAHTLRKKILVHCVAGASRSVSLVAAWMAHTYDKPVEEMIDAERQQ